MPVSVPGAQASATTDKALSNGEQDKKINWDILDVRYDVGPFLYPSHAANEHILAIMGWVPPYEARVEARPQHRKEDSP